MNNITLIDIRIPFIRLVFFFVKAALAVIPAVVILVIACMLLGAAVAWLTGAEMNFMMRGFRV